MAKIRVVEIRYGKKSGLYIMCKKETLAGPFKTQYDANTARREWAVVVDNWKGS